MDADRSARLTIDQQEYRLVLTTRATKEIARRYGGLENLGEKLLKAENFEMALEEIVWLIALLANQGILIRNRMEGEKRPLLTEEDVELLTSPMELAVFKDAILEALLKGTRRDVESEENPSKNA